MDSIFYIYVLPALIILLKSVVLLVMAVPAASMVLGNSLLRQFDTMSDA